tara:strand:- start:398 stop:550 length:153 start_codon:yes stop_codon:yes gene_type:complete
MKKNFSIPLLASLTLPTTVNAETYWIMAGGRSAPAGAYATSNSWSSLQVL